MADPVVEQIAGEIMDAIGEISVQNGYQHDVGRVLRPTRVGYTDGAELVSPMHLDVLLIQVDRVRIEGIEGEGPAVEWDAQWDAIGFTLPADTDATAIDEVANRFSADIEKAVMADPTRHGTAVTTDIVSDVEVTLENGAFAGRGVRIKVRYRTAENDPFVNRTA